MVEEKPTAETVEVLKLKLEFECEERLLARVKRLKKAREATEAEAQRAHNAEKALHYKMAGLVKDPLRIKLVPLTLLEILD